MLLGRTLAHYWRRVKLVVSHKILFQTKEHPRTHELRYTGQLNVEYDWSKLRPIRGWDDRLVDHCASSPSDIRPARERHADAPISALCLWRPKPIAARVT